MHTPLVALVSGSQSETPKRETASEEIEGPSFEEVVDEGETKETSPRLFEADPETAVVAAVETEEESEADELTDLGLPIDAERAETEVPLEDIDAPILVDVQKPIEQKKEIVSQAPETKSEKAETPPKPSLTEALVQMQAGQPSTKAAGQQAVADPAIAPKQATAIPVASVPDAENSELVTDPAKASQLMSTAPQTARALDATDMKKLETLPEPRLDKLTSGERLVPTDVPMNEPVVSKVGKLVAEPQLFDLQVKSGPRVEMAWPPAPEPRTPPTPSGMAVQIQSAPIPVVPAQNMAIAEKDKALTFDPSRASEQSIGSLGGSDTARELRQAVSSVVSTVATRADLPVNVARQIAEVLQRSQGQAVELKLHPAELGRVRMTLSPAENGIVVAIHTERPETLDLMRRNIDSLEQSFGELGYEDISFSFGTGEERPTDDRSERSESDGRSETLVTREEAVAATVVRLPIAGAHTGLDVRV